MAKLSGSQCKRSPNITSFEKSYQLIHVYNKFKVTTHYGLQNYRIVDIDANV